MPEPKTKPNDASVADFLNTIADAQVREDCWTIVDMMRTAAKAEPRMWGTSIVGFGECPYVSADGREVAWPVTGFSPRKQNLTLYIMDGLEHHGELISRLGKHSCGKGCLYIKRLSDVQLPVLKKLVQTSVQRRMRKRGK